MAFECQPKSETKERETQFERYIKRLPASKCTPNQLSSLVKNFYKSYKEYPISFFNCAKRHKAYAVSDDCKNFKIIIKDSTAAPGVPDLVKQLNICNSGKDESCSYTGQELFDCCNKKYQNPIDNLGIDYTINDAYNKCINKYGKCGIYSVNDIRYYQDNIFRRIGYINVGLIVFMIILSTSILLVLMYKKLRR